MEQENKLAKNSRGNGIKSAKGLKNNLLMRCKKGTRGITLIALVITIIVLLILAGVAIATLLGDNGIITRATTAKEKTQQAGVVERVQIEVQGSYGTDGLLDYKELQKNLNNVQGIDKESIPTSIESASFPIKVTVDGADVEIKESGEVKLAFNAKEWDKTASEEDCFYWESDIEGEEGYNTIIGYTKKIENYAKLRFPSRCKEIKFEDNGGYKDNVQMSESRAFTNNIEKIEIPGTTTIIGHLAFGDPNSKSFQKLKIVDIETGITSIESHAFQGCYQLTKITIPDSVINIGDYAFYCCTGLTEITIPDSVTNIGYSSFSIISDNAVFHVVKGSYADTWLSKNKYENQTIEYITE